MMISMKDTVLRIVAEDRGGDGCPPRTIDITLTISAENVFHEPGDEQALLDDLRPVLANWLDVRSRNINLARVFEDPDPEDGQ